MVDQDWIPYDLERKAYLEDHYWISGDQIEDHAGDEETFETVVVEDESFAGVDPDGLPKD